jgi:hypothetical protein
VREHDAEPIWGLPERPPVGELVLWQGAPDWRRLARDAFHHRKLSFYLGALWVWSFVAAIPFTLDSATSVARNAGLALAALGLVALYAWLTARTTAYTITNQRVVMRIGIALPSTINLPFAQVDGANLRVNADGTGDLTLALRNRQRVGYLLIWPHARPWRLTRPEPSLRSIPDAGRVAQILSRALAASAEQPAPSVQAIPQPVATGVRAPAAA